MQTKKRILLRKHCVSFLVEDDHDIYILKSGHPDNYVVITDTPYDAPEMQNMTLSEVAKLLGVSEMAIEIGLS